MLNEKNREPNPGTLQSIPATLEFRDLGRWKPGTLESRTLQPCNPGTWNRKLEPSNPATLEPWNSGTLEPWNLENVNDRTLKM